MAKSEFAFATVKTVKPLTIQLDGDSTVIPAVAYGITVKTKQRVEVRIRKHPQPPLITRVLNASSGIVMMDPANQFAFFTGTKDTSDESADISSGWVMAEASPGFTISDGGVLTVDPDVYPDGTVLAVNATYSAGPSPDETKSTWVLIYGFIGLSFISLKSFVSYDNVSLHGDATSCLAVVRGGAVNMSLHYELTEPTAAVTGSFDVVVYAYPLLTGNA